MINFKKSIVSVATVLAISSTAVIADYIPLTNTSTDNVWRLFGVNGFLVDGDAGTTAGTFSITDSFSNTVVDDGSDELPTWGFNQIENLGSVEAISSQLSSVEVRIDTAGIVYKETDPLRTVYVTSTTGDAPQFSVTYKASLEGKRVEYSIYTDGTDAHTFTLNSVNTFNNPAVGTTIVDAAGTGTPMSAAADVVDYNFTGNPPSVSYYDKAVHQSDNPALSESLRLYAYDASNQKWDLYDSGNVAASNDFTDLLKGKGYWGKIDTNTTSIPEAGVVLGSSVLTTADYIAAGLTDGWNLMSFDSQDRDIRIASTGMRVTVNASTGPIKLIDAASNHEVSVDFNGTVTPYNLSVFCKDINIAIKTAKSDGIIPDTFHLKAFPISGTEVSLISNKRFILKEDGNTTFGAATTLAGQVLLDPNTLVDTLENNITSTGMMTKYGEFAVVIDPLIEASTASTLDPHAASIHIKGATATTGDLVMDINSTATIIQTATYLSTHPDINATPIDLEYDGVAIDSTDHILLTSTEPFFIRDHTFTRAFEYAIDANGTITIDSTGGAGGTVTVGDSNSSAFITSLINATDVNASVSGSNIIIINNQVDGNEFTVTEAVTSDNLTDVISTVDMAKGAVKGVYSLNYFATRALENRVDLNVSFIHDDVGDDSSFNINGLGLNTDYNLTGVSYDGNSSSDWTTYFNRLVSTLKQVLAAEYIVASVEHNYSGILADVNSSFITVTGPDIIDIDIVTTNVVGTPTYGNIIDVNGTADLGNLATISPDLTVDLKYNATYTPNYVVDGPLYTMKEAGFTAKAMVTGNMNFTDLTVSWDSIDLTRKPSEWLDSQDYNLFSVDDTSGYWVYLESGAAANPLVVTNPSFGANYTHHFNSDAGDGTTDQTAVTYNSVSGNFEIEITGLDEYDNRTSARASAFVAGTSIELARAALTSNVYQGKLSSYEVKQMTSGSDYEIFANIADGLGYNLKSYNTTLVVDYKKPNAPTLDLSSGVTVAVSSTSADAAGYYIFNGQVPEVGTSTATNLVAALLSADAGAYALCGEMDALAFGDSVYSLNIFAVDGTGVLGGGNASDVKIYNYAPLLKSAIGMTDINNGVSDATLTGNVYDATCADGGVQTKNYGVTLTSETNLETVKLAYNPIEGADLTAVPLTVFVTDEVTAGTVTGAVAKITYPDVYAGKRVYVELNGKVYDFVLPTSALLDTQGNGKTDAGSDIADLSGVLGNEMTDQTL